MESATSTEEMSLVEDKITPVQFSDHEYYTSYEDLEIHRLMVGDVPRTRAYQRAVEDNKHLFKDKTVMDVGAGTGILSLFAAAAGAKRVYAVEASNTASLVKRVANDNGYGEVITVIHARVEDVQLDSEEKVDVIISEWMGFYLVHESMLNSVLEARDRFLSEDGIMFPSEARLYASPCTLECLYKEQLDFWDNVYGFNMTAIRSSVLDSKGKKPEVCIVKPEDLLSKPVCFKTFNLRWMDVEEVYSFSEDMFVDVSKAGKYHGVCVWFECDFDGRDYDEEGAEFGKLVTLSTSPFSEPTHWKQTVVAFGKAGIVNNSEHSENGSAENCTIKKQSNGESETSMISDISRTSSSTKKDLPDDFLDLEQDEVIGWRFEFVQSASNSRHYTICLQMLDPETDEHPEPCNCTMPQCLIIAKLIENELKGPETLMQPTS